MCRRSCPRIPQWLSARSKVSSPRLRFLLPELRMSRLSHASPPVLAHRNALLHLGGRTGEVNSRLRPGLLGEQLNPDLRRPKSARPTRRSARLFLGSTSRISFGPRQGVLKHRPGPGLRHPTTQNPVLRHVRCPKTCPWGRPQQEMNRAKLSLVLSGPSWIPVKAQPRHLYLLRRVPRFL